MAAPLEGKPCSPLATYLTDVLLARWKSDRKDLETKWEKNDRTIRKIRQVNWKQGEGEGWRADSFVGIVKQKWLAGVALVLDFILEGGQLGFALKVNKMGRDLPQEVIDEQADTIAQAEQKIRSQLEICRIDRETIKAVQSAGKYGMTWGHYYTGDYRRRTYQEVNEGVQGVEQQRFEEVIEDIETPMVEYVPVWEMYWDMTQDNVEDMEGLCREQNMSAYQLRKMADNGEGWLKKEIEHVITAAKGDGATSDDENVSPGRKYLEYDSKTIKYREFWTLVPNSVIKEYEKSLRGTDKAIESASGGKKNDEDDDPNMSMDDESGHESHCLCVTANDIVVRFITVDEDDDPKPFLYTVWEDDLDSLPGVGVADNGYELQEIFNGLWNAYQDNKKLAGDIQGVYNPIAFGKDQDMTVQPGKFRPVTDIGGKNIENAFRQFVFQDTSQQFEPVMAMVRESIDEETHIPKTMQGAQGGVQKTAFETNEIVTNSGKYIAGVIRNVDNGWTEPTVTRFYKFNMADPDVTEGKGNFIAAATGFTSYQSKVVRTNKIMQLLSLTISSPTLENLTNIMKLLEELYRANDLDPDEFLYGVDDMPEDGEPMEPEQQMEDPELVELEKESKRADIDKTKVDTETAMADQMRKNEELKLKQVEAIKRAQQPMEMLA